MEWRCWYYFYPSAKKDQVNNIKKFLRKKISPNLILIVGAIILVGYIFNAPTSTIHTTEATVKGFAIVGATLLVYFAFSGLGQRNNKAKKTKKGESGFEKVKKKDVYESELSKTVEDDFIVYQPGTKETAIEDSIKEINEDIAKKRTTIAKLSEEVANLQYELTIFEAEYQRIIGVLFVSLDELDLKIKTYLERINILKQGEAEDLLVLEKIIEDKFKTEYEKIRLEREEAEQHTREYEYEEVKKKPELDRESENKLKAIYRELAKRYHPDMAKTKEEEKRFHKIMAEINQAYNDKDLSRMEEIFMKLKTPEKVFFQETLEEKLERLLNECEKLDKIVLKLQDELSSIRNSDTYILKTRVEEAARERRDLLKEMEEDLKAKITMKEEKLTNIKQEFMNLVTESAL